MSLKNKIFKVSLFCFCLFIVNSSFVFADDYLSVAEAISNAEKVLEINSRLVRGNTQPLYCKDGGSFFAIMSNWWKASCHDNREVSADEYKEFFPAVLEAEKQFQLSVKNENNADLLNALDYLFSINTIKPIVIKNFLRAYYDKIVFYSDQTDCEVLERMNGLKENYPDEFNDCLNYWCADREKFDLFIAKVKERCPSSLINQLKHFMETSEIEKLEEAASL